MTMSFKHPTVCNDLLNYRLARLLGSSGAPIIRICEGRYGITRREWRLIAMLADFGPLSPSALADHAHTDRPLVSRAINDLVDKGLVSRIVAPDDKRRASVALTDKGRELHGELFPQTANINASVLASLSEEELRVFDRALDVLTEAASRLNQEYALTEKADRHRGGSRRHQHNHATGTTLSDLW
jgi:DNA-binding MarR family transcriptional regulator